MDNSSLRVVFAGTPDFAVSALESIVDSRHEVVGVVTNPDRPAGRGKKSRPPAVKKAALKADLPVYQPESIKSEEAEAQLRDWAPDVMVVAAYGHILPERILNLPEHGCLNIHASLLPKYRGAAPINWAIVRGEDETGVTIMQMDPGMDTGPMLLKARTEIGPLETGQDLHDRLAAMGADLIVEALEDLAAGELEPTSQDDDGATYAPMLSTSDAEIDWSEPARRVADHIRGFNPWPGAYSYFERDGDRDRIKFHLARPAEDLGQTLDGADLQPGEVLEADPGADRLVVACGEGAIEVLEIQGPGRRKMEAGDFLNGYDLEVGDCFG